MSWFKDFGWMLIIYFTTVILSFLFCSFFRANEFFPILFAIIHVLIIFSFMFLPRLHLINLVYILIGRVPSLKYLIMSIIFSHLYFALIFSSFYNNTQIIQYKNKMHYDVLINVFYTSFLMQPSPDFEEIINPHNKIDSTTIKTIKNMKVLGNGNLEKIERKGFLILIIFQLIFAYFYFGTFISTLYQKLKKE